MIKYGHVNFAILLTMILLVLALVVEILNLRNTIKTSNIKQDKTWICDSCTFENKDSNIRCSICEKDRKESFRPTINKTLGTINFELPNFTITMIADITGFRWNE